MLKRLLLVSALALATLSLGHSTRVFAQQSVILCQAPNVPCTLSGPQSDTGDPAWLFNGRNNFNFGQLYGMFGPTSHLVTAGSATASDITGLYTGTPAAGWCLGSLGALIPCSGGGTVTSVGITVPAGMAVAGSPITTAGTFAITNTLTGPIKGSGTGFASALSSDIIGLWTGTCNSTTFLRADGTCQTAGGSGSGTVSSVGLTAPAWLTVTGSPITTAGTLALTGTSEPANEVLASPNGSPGALAPRALVSADIPTSLNSLTSATSLSAVGTITAGVWQGTVLGPAYGGSGEAGTITGVLKGNGTSPFTAALSSDVLSLWSGTCSSSTYLRGDGSCQTPPGSGTVTSVALSAPSVFSITGSPVTGAGTLAMTFAGGQTANEFLATPNGVSGAVGLRAIVAADIPTLNQNTTGNAATATALAATPTQCTAGQFSTGIAASGDANCAAGGVSSFTGDSVLLSNSASTGAVTATLANTGVGYGVFGNITATTGAPAYHALSTYPTTAFPTLNQNTTGTAANITATTNATLTTLSALSLPSGQVTGLGALATVTPGTGVATALGVNVGSAGSVVTNGGALGTPSSGTATNITGTAAGLTAGTATAANGLNSATTTVAVSAATAPTAGQVLTATSGTAAAWQTPTTGSGTVNSGTSGQVAYYAANGTTVSGATVGGGLSLSSGTLATSTPNRTVTTSPTVGAADMGGVLYTNVSGGGTVTIPAISSTVFASGMSLIVVNYSTSTAAISTTPTVNSGGGCVTANGIPSAAAWFMSSNGTTLDCVQVGSAASLKPVVAGGSGTSFTPVCSVGLPTTVNTYTATGALTINLPTGCGDGQQVQERIKFTASETYAFNAGYHAGTTTGITALPTASSSASGEDYLQFAEDTANSRFNYLAIASF